ncbi:MAG: hypothetical protein RR234_00935 [Christensenella sp.]
MSFVLMIAGATGAIVAFFSLIISMLYFGIKRKALSKSLDEELGK